MIVVRYSFDICFSIRLFIWCDDDYVPNSANLKTSDTESESEESGNIDLEIMYSYKCQEMYVEVPRD